MDGFTEAMNVDLRNYGYQLLSSYYQFCMEKLLGDPFLDSQDPGHRHRFGARFKS
jgi:hypothetical protein